MNNVYKLADENGRTHGGTQWGPGVTHEAPGNGELCTAGWIHCYSDPLLAVLLDHIGADFGPTRRLWEAKAEGRTLDDHGLKFGVQRLTTVREISVPVVSQTQTVAFGIICAREVYPDATWRVWADAWLSGTDRTAEAAAWAGEAAAREAARAAEAAARAKTLDLISLARQAMLVTP